MRETNGQGLNRTPLASIHEALGAKMIDFGGWWMPVQYAGILEEHRCVRENVGLFDLSHMGEIEVRGRSATDFLQRLVTNDTACLSEGEAVYTPMCRPSGGIVDDLIVYRQSDDRYLLVVNAANIEKDVAWIGEHCPPDASFENRSDAVALIAVQGPSSREVLSRLTDVDLGGLAFRRFLPDADVAGVRVMLSRTGYTGELGYELFCDAGDAERLWTAMYAAVEAVGGLPIGLGARDTLRLEARLLLYGNDIDESTTPLEAGIGWAVDFDKPTFIGLDALRREKRDGSTRRLIGFVMDDRAIARSGYDVFRGDDRIGAVTSGGPSPMLGRNIGLALIARAHAKVGRRIEIQIRRKRHPARVVRTPFYRPTSP